VGVTPSRRPFAAESARLKLRKDGECQPLTARPTRPMRESLFAAEYPLLAALGLHRSLRLPREVRVDGGVAIQAIRLAVVELPPSVNERPRPGIHDACRSVRVGVDCDDLAGGAIDPDCPVGVFRGTSGIERIEYVAEDLY
jgi:hypothetical protein